MEKREIIERIMETLKGKSYAEIKSILLNITETVQKKSVFV